MQIDSILPKQNETTSFVSKNNLKTKDIITHVIKKNEGSEISMSLYSINPDSLLYLKEIKNKISKLTFYVSTFIPNMQKEAFEKSKEIAIEFNSNMYFCNSHIKVVLIKTNNNYFVINSTMNNQNTKYEHTEIIDSKNEYVEIEQCLKQIFK